MCACVWAGGGGGGGGKCVNRKVEDYDYELVIKPVTRCILPSSAFDGLFDSLRPAVVANKQVDSSVPQFLLPGCVYPLATSGHAEAHMVSLRSPILFSDHGGHLP